jgi:hypothetical protein
MVWAEVGWVGIGWIVEAAQVVTIEMSGAFLLTKVLLVDFHWRSRQGKTKAQHRSALFSPLMTFLGNPAHNWEIWTAAPFQPANDESARNRRSGTQRLAFPITLSDYGWPVGGDPLAFPGHPDASCVRLAP